MVDKLKCAHVTRENKPHWFLHIKQESFLKMNERMTGHDMRVSN